MDLEKSDGVVWTGFFWLRIENRRTQPHEVSDHFKKLKKMKFI
jgi:hypothetical protein